MAGRFSTSASSLREKRIRLAMLAELKPAAGPSFGERPDSRQLKKSGLRKTCSVVDHDNVVAMEHRAAHYPD